MISQKEFTDLDAAKGPRLVCWASTVIGTNSEEDESKARENLTRKLMQGTFRRTNWS